MQFPGTYSRKERPDFPESETNTIRVKKKGLETDKGQNKNLVLGKKTNLGGDILWAGAKGGEGEKKGASLSSKNWLGSRLRGDTVAG